MKIQFVTVRTRDLAGSVSFYERLLGFTLVRRFTPRPGMEIAFLSDGAGGQIEFIQGSDEKPYSGSGISIGFQVEDIGSTAKMLEAEGVPIVYGPMKMPNGVTLLGARDLNGLELGFLQEA